ncbi:MAG: hypothetical protein AAGN15_23355 [Cyanobacteria bacterium J06581_3]
MGEERDYSLEAGARGLYEFGRNIGENAGRLAEDIASGWNQRAAEGRQTPYPTDEYRPNYDAGDRTYQYDELDQGWENFDDYSEPPIQGPTKRTYGDSLYGGEEDELDDGYADQPAEDIDADDVYDADYRVIEPPSKPLS